MKNNQALRWRKGWVIVPDTLRGDLVVIWEAVCKMPPKEEV